MNYTRPTKQISDKSKSGEINFNQPSNGQVCGCGKHHGVGEWTPEQRAAVYARIRDNMPSQYQSHQRAYLESWLTNHGDFEWDYAAPQQTQLSDGSKSRTVTYRPTVYVPRVR